MKPKDLKRSRRFKYSYEEFMTARPLMISEIEENPYETFWFNRHNEFCRFTHYLVFSPKTLERYGDFITFKRKTGEILQQHNGFRLQMKRLAGDVPIEHDFFKEEYQIMVESPDWKELFPFIPRAKPPSNG